MKFLIISNLYEPYARGGAEAVAKTMAEGLAARGHEVVVVTGRPRHTRDTFMLYSMKVKFFFRFYERVECGVRVLSFFPPNLFFVRDDGKFPWIVRALWRLIDLFNVPAAMALSGVLDREKPDVIITHHLVGMGMLTPWVIRHKKIQHVHVLHDVHLIVPSGLLMGGHEQMIRRWWLYRVMTRMLFGFPAVIVSPSRWLLDFHTTRGFFKNSKTIVMQNPVFRPPITHFDAVQHQSGRLRLFFAGQLEVHKGVRWLLDLRLKIKDLQVMVEFAGSGSLESEVRRLAEADPVHVIFHGKLSREELFKKFADVDALIVPSLCYENAPQIIAEALAAGLPVVASRIGGIPELVHDGENGFLFTPSDEKEFVTALLKLKTKKIEPHGAIMSIEQYLDTLLELCQDGYIWP